VAFPDRVSFNLRSMGPYAKSLRLILDQSSRQVSLW
jgi:hypothetical protein